MNLEEILKSNKLRKITKEVVKPLVIIGTGVVAHEYIHGLIALALGGTFEGVTIDPLSEISCMAYSNKYSNYSLLHQSIINLSPHLLLGIPGIYIIKNEIKMIKSVLKNKRNKLAITPNIIHISTALGFYLMIPYGMGDTYGHGIGGGDFVNATKHIKEFMSNYNPLIVNYINNRIPEFVQTLATVTTTFGLSFLGYISSKKLFRMANSYYHKNFSRNIKHK